MALHVLSKAHWATARPMKEEIQHHWPVHEWRVGNAAATGEVSQRHHRNGGVFGLPIPQK